MRACRKSSSPSKPHAVHTWRQGTSCHHREDCAAELQISLRNLHFYEVASILSSLKFKARVNFFKGSVFLINHSYSHTIS